MTVASSISSARVTAVFAALAACAASVGGCDAQRDGRPMSEVLDVEPGECVELGELALACADDETCDPEDLLEAPLCGSQSQDGVMHNGWLDGKIAELKESLVERAAQCYEDQDSVCLWRTYWALAAGAQALRLNTASSNMFNFLHCWHDPQLLSESSVRADPVVARYDQDVAGEFWCQAEADALNDPNGSVTLEMPASVVAAEESDIWYGLGNFTVSSTGTAYVYEGEVTGVEVVTVVYDVYDWHAGLAASGPETQVAGFRDDWAAWLVDEGAACEFEMGVTYRSWVERPANPSCGAPPTSEEPRDE